MQAVMRRAAPARVKNDQRVVVDRPSDLRKRGPTPKIPQDGSSGVMFFINTVVSGLHTYAGTG